MAEKLTPTFVFKLVLLFALLLTGVYVRTNQAAPPAAAKNVQINKEKALDDKEEQHQQDMYFRLVKTEKSDEKSI